MVVDVKEVRERTSLIAQITEWYSRSERLLGESFTCSDPKQSSELYKEGIEAANFVEYLKETYYTMFPKCATRQVAPWAV